MTLLRTRGGISTSRPRRSLELLSSPHTRRYFRVSTRCVSLVTLFSAHAEVFPRPGANTGTNPPLLRTRGGISNLANLPRGNLISSPHTRRYFHGSARVKNYASLFSAHAEVFPRLQVDKSEITALLRTRGGISEAIIYIHAARYSSPHTRRYFRQCLQSVR